MWENRGLIFELVSPFADSAREFAIQSYKRASELEPTNPVLFYRLGENQRLLWLESASANATADREAAADEEVDDFNLSVLDEAIQNLERAAELKPDYFAPRYSLTLIAESQNDLDKAIDYLVGALQYQANQTASSYYELSRLIYNRLLASEDSNNQIELQQILLLLNNAIQRSPNFANALYTRALVQRQLGNFADAVADMQQVVDLNPESTEALAKLAELKRQASSIPTVAPGPTPELELEPGPAEE